MQMYGLIFFSQITGIQYLFFYQEKKSDSLECFFFFFFVLLNATFSISWVEEAIANEKKTKSSSK